MFPSNISAILVKHINSRLCPLDIILVVNQFEQGYDPNRIEKVFFPLKNLKTFKLLERLGYPELLKELITAIQIEPEVRDVFRSEFHEEFIDFSNSQLRKQAALVEFEADSIESRFIASAPNFLIDFSLPVISQFHSEMELVAESINQFILAVGGNPTALFLNAKGASFISNFAMTWIAMKMGIPANGSQINNGLTGVM